MHILGTIPMIAFLTVCLYSASHQHDCSRDTAETRPWDPDDFIVPFERWAPKTARQQLAIALSGWLMLCDMLQAFIWLLVKIELRYGPSSQSGSGEERNKIWLKWVVCLFRGNFRWDQEMDEFCFCALSLTFSLVQYVLYKHAQKCHLIGNAFHFKMGPF